MLIVSIRRVRVAWRLRCGRIDIPIARLSADYGVYVPFCVVGGRPYCEVFEVVVVSSHLCQQVSLAQTGRNDGLEVGERSLNRLPNFGRGPLDGYFFLAGTQLFHV